MKIKKIFNVTFFFAGFISLILASCSGSDSKNHSNNNSDAGGRYKEGNLLITLDFNTVQSKTLMAAKSCPITQSDISSIHIAVDWSDGTKSADCTKTGSKWQCSLEQIPAGELLTITLSGKNAQANEIYSGNLSNITIQPDITNEISVTMEYVGTVESVNSPAVINISVNPSTIYTGENADFSAEIVGQEGSTVKIVLESSNPEASFNASTFEHTFTQDPFVLSSTYTAGTSASIDTITMFITNECNYTTTADDNITVVAQGGANVRLSLPPDVTINASISGSQTTFNALVEGIQAPDTISAYEWLVNDTPIANSNDDSIAIDNPALGTKVTVKVSVTSGETVRTYQYSIIWGK